MADGKSEVAGELDLSVLRYSKVWEDQVILEKALDIQPDDVVLSITSAGDNVLNLLLQRPALIVAVDLSPIQNALLELKLAAIRELSHSKLLLLLGLHGTGQQRLDLFRQLQTLPDYARHVLQKGEDLLGTGIIHCGRLDKYIERYRNDHLIPCVGEERLRKVCLSKSVAEQKDLFERWPLDDLYARTVRHFDAETQAESGRHKAQLKHVEMDSTSAGEFLASKFFMSLRSRPLRESVYMRWILLGPPSPEETAACIAGELESEGSYLPPYLHKECFQQLKGLVSRVEVRTGSIEAFVDEARSFSKANLSDIFEYMSADNSRDLFERLASVCSPKGRLAFWNFYVNRVPDESESSPWQRLGTLSDQLTAEDRMFAYGSFHVVERL